MITRRLFLFGSGLAAAMMAGRAHAAAVLPGTETFIMPAEWEPHEGCFMALSSAWDHYDSREVDAIRAEQAAIAKAIRRFEPVTMLVNPGDGEDARRLCGRGIDVVELSHYGGSVRDTLPSVVRDAAGARIAIGWNFDAWGDAFDGYDADFDLAERFATHAGLPFRRADIVTEPGAFATDGAGTVLASETALLDSRRNEGRSRADIEDQFRRFLGARKVVWLRGSRADVITDGHVDSIAKFLAPGKLVAEISDDTDDPDYHDLHENHRRLAGLTDAAGRPVEVVAVQRPRWDFLGDRAEDFAASYVNCYIANGGLVMPTFGDPVRDDAARAVFARLADGRAVVSVRVDRICARGSGIHGYTQQIPLALPVTPSSIP